jgi:uncharacterized phage-associated protein
VLLNGVLLVSYQLSFDARAIANHLLEIASANKISLTNLQLQKIVFFAHGTFVARYGVPLVINRFEAWEHGPVIPELYHCLKQFGERPIRAPIQRYDLESALFVVVSADLPAQVREHLAQTLLFYGRMDAWELVKLSHQVDGPWDRTLRQAKGTANFSLVISPQIIKEYFDCPDNIRH